MSAQPPQTIRLCRDKSCPGCGFPETYAEVDPTASTPSANAVGCRRCGWHQVATPAPDSASTKRRHALAEDLAPLCGDWGSQGDGLHLTPVVEHVTCPACIEALTATEHEAAGPPHPTRTTGDDEVRFAEESEGEWL